MWLFVCPSMLGYKGPQEFDVAVCVSLYVERNMMWLFVCPSILSCKGSQEHDVAVCVPLYVEM
ncbi:hypothetical protein MAR_011904 [Mya arenaria]|uniref:Uncharacterized protein n=1 Tax=Mya arenaria TaxID=6604 RepID=A0ABY7FVF6_MYAAR|nr:hypothetical protein MAR_011904 [Mya arenaria]